jgi:hypothetical protein
MSLELILSQKLGKRYRDAGFTLVETEDHVELLVRVTSFQTTGCQAIRVNCHDTCLWKSPESCANCEGR